MAQMVGRNVAAPLLFLNLIMYIIVVGFASWNLNHFINGQTNYPGELRQRLAMAHRVRGREEMGG